MIPRNEYPRPQLVRDKWTNLNGEWYFQIDNEMSGEEKVCPPRKNRHKIATKNGMNRNNSFIFVEAGAFIPRFA